MKKLIVLSLALLMIVPMLAMAGGSGEAQEAGGEFDPADYQVAIATPGINHPVLRIVQLGFLQAAEELGYDAEVIGTDGWNMQDVYAAVDTFINTGGDALMLWAGDETAFPTYRKLEAAGIPVGTAHFRFQPHPQGLTFGMACDSEVYGREAADFIAERIKGKRGTIAITQHSSNTTEDASSAAFTARMKELNLPGVRVLEPEFEGGDLNAAININAAIIQRNPDIIAAFGLTGNSPVTWAGAVKAAGRAPGEIVIVGMDYTEANLALIESGEVAAIVAQPLYEEAYLTMEYLDRVLRGGTVPQWTQLEAPLVYKGGTGASDPATYANIIEEVKTWFK